MRKAIKIAGAVFQGVVVTAAIAAAAIFVLPRLFGWRVVTVVSGSMTPAYAVDAVLAINPVNPADIREGDVIAFATESDRPLVTHRVVAIEHDAGGLAFVTKGDANEESDFDPVAASAVRGRVVFGVPYLGLFVRAIHNPIGFAALLLLPGVLLIGQEILSIRRDRRDWRERRAWRTLFASTSPWPAPIAAEAVPGPEIFDFWTTIATQDRYYEELGHEVLV